MNTRWGIVNLVAFLALVSLPVACRSAPNVSATCTVATDCDEGLTCNAAVTGGYCTQACTVAGKTEGCPEDSICDTFGNQLWCQKICKVQSDCRSDLECTGVTSSNIKACRPKK